MDFKKDLLLCSAARLYSLGIDLEAAKERIRKLVDCGVGYDAPEMTQAVKEYSEIKELWDSLEADYLRLKKDVVTRNG